VARQLFAWLDLVNPPEGEAVDPTQPTPGNAATGAPPLPPLLSALAPSDARAVAALRVCDDVTAALRALSGRGGGGPGGGGGNRHGVFPGAMPVNLFRRHLPQLESGGEYFVTEKTDGERKLLVVAEVAASSSISSGGSGSASPPRAAAVGLLVDRSMRVSSVRGSSSSGGDGDGCFGGLPAGTVLDGEVVFNLTLQRHVFMVFDVLSLGYAAPAGGGSGCLVHLPWRQRVSQLPLAALAATQTASHPLPLGAKTFWPASKVDQLFKHMVAGTRVHGCYFPKVNLLNSLIVPLALLCRRQRPRARVSHRSPRGRSGAVPGRAPQNGRRDFAAQRAVHHGHRLRAFEVEVFGHRK
jgi:hypothetical protein